MPGAEAHVRNPSFGEAEINRFQELAGHPDTLAGVPQVSVRELVSGNKVVDS